MGNPQNYSLDVPRRCLALIDALWPTVVDQPAHAEKYGGPLTSTFLLAMATPAIVLPIERIEKHLGNGDERAPDDRYRDLGVTKAVEAVFRSDRRLDQCPFFNSRDGWSYAYVADRFNVSRGVYGDLAAELGRPGAREAARALDAKIAIHGVRNALAHGSVGFLDDRGTSTDGNISAMFALVSEKRNAVNGRKVDGYHILRISEGGFRSFLHRWVSWLDKAGIEMLMAA